MPIGFNPLFSAGLGDLMDLLPDDNTVSSPNPLTGFTPQTKATDAYLNMLQNFPQRNQPTKTQKITGALAGLGGNTPQDALQIQDLIRYRPFYQQLQDWESRIKPAEAAALNEKNYNQNMRMLLYDQGRLSNQKAAIENRASNEAEKRQIDWYKGYINDVRAKNQGKVIQVNKDGNVELVDKATNQVTALPDPLNNNQPMKGDVILKLQKAQERANTMAAAQMAGIKTRADLAPRPIYNDPSGGAYTIAPGTTVASPVTIGPPPNAAPTQTATTPAKPGETPVPPTKPPVAAKLTNKAQTGKTAQPANIAAIRDSAQQTLGALNEILDEKDQLRPEVGKYVGLGRAKGLIEAWIPGAEGRTAQAKIARLKNLLTLELIGEMKQQSRTGATGFGQLSTRELNVLEQAASKLDPGIEKEAFRTELIRIKDRLRKILMSPDGADVKKTPDELFEQFRKDKK